MERKTRSWLHQPGPCSSRRPGLALLIGHELWPAKVALDTAAVGLLALLLIVIALPIVKEVTLPGGMAWKLREEVRTIEPVLGRAEANAEQDAQVAVASPEAVDTVVPPDVIPDEGHAEFRLPEYLMDLAERQPAARS